jgi:hypothetical protein
MRDTGYGTGDRSPLRGLSIFYISDRDSPFRTFRDDSLNHTSGMAVYGQSGFYWKVVGVMAAVEENARK